jgi:hypothetical protein
MQIKPDEITSILKSRIEGLDAGSAELTEVGTVLSVADGIARVHGLENCRSLEMLELPHGVTGLALNLESDNVGAVLFGEWEKVVEGDTVKRTDHLLDIPVGEGLLGRIVDPLGRPLDGKGDIAHVATISAQDATIGDLIRAGKLLEVHCGNCRPERQLYLKFHDGREWRYFDFPAYQYDEFLKSESLGRYFGKRIRGKFREEEVHETPLRRELKTYSSSQ